MKIVIVDGQGGKIGKTLVERVKKLPLKADVYAIGTNSIATSAMVKAGAEHAATGENPLTVNARDADFIIGPIGIVIADSLLGEITPAMAAAVGQSRAVKILLPVNKCNNLIVGIKQTTVSEQVDEAVELLMRSISAH